MPNKKAEAAAPEDTRLIPAPAVVPDVQIVKIKLAETGDTVELTSSSAASMVSAGHATYLAEDSDADR